jgi:H+/Cl- antiporter ClcA
MMANSAPSELQRATLWIALALALVLMVLGISWYGVSFDVRQRVWSDIFDRLSGPMTFRLILQPIMALIAAVPDGLRDAREGHTSFFWNSPGDRTLQRGRLWEGLYASGRILLLGLCIDMIYQYRVFDSFYPVEAVLFALLLCVIPYFIWRSLVERIARWRMHHPQQHSAKHSAMGSPDE